jgi:type VI secretion system protein ImpH
MQTTTWRDRTGVIRQLLARPQHYDFFQAVHLLDTWLRCQRVRHSLDSVLRFTNSISLSFPASQVEALAIDEKLIRITPAFIGFLGAKGALPYCYTEAIAAQVHRDKEDSGRSFLDCFSQRSVMLFYRAWQACRVEYRFGPDGRDDFLAMQLALAGHAGRTDDAAIPAEVVAHYAAAVRQRPVSAAWMSAVLNDYFGVPIRLEPFVGVWERLQDDELPVLGSKHCRLGTMILGHRYHTRDVWVRLWIGPLSRADYDHFHDDGEGGMALKAMLALFAVPELRFEVRLILRAADVTPLVLGSGARLGRATVLRGYPANVDHDETRYLIEPF